MTAVISDCGRYRYTLARTWDESRHCLPFCMLNPSTADAEQDDPTIRRCVSFAKREGYGGIHVVNLFAFRATKPSDLRTAQDPVGTDNMLWIERTIDAASMFGVPIVCAWGAHDADQIGRRLRESVAKLVCLGKTKWGCPRHPLYVRADQPLVRYP